MELHVGVIILWMSMVPLVMADWQLEVYFNQYINSEHKSSGRGGMCCDEGGYGPCLYECDNQFTFCLRPAGYPVWSEECPLGSYRTGLLPGDNVHYQFGIELEPNIPNPLVFNGTGEWPGDFQLYVRVFDQDRWFGNIVDNVYIEAAIPVTTTFSPIYFYEGTSRWAVMYLSFLATNVDNNADITVASCSMGCYGGVCSGGVCMCNEGYSGETCEMAVDVCANLQPCMNGGTCTNMAPDEYHCVCSSGFEGKNCTTPQHTATLTSGVLVSSSPATHPTPQSQGFTGLEFASSESTGPAQEYVLVMAVVPVATAVVGFIGGVMITLLVVGIVLRTRDKRQTTNTPRNDSTIVSNENIAYAPPHHSFEELHHDRPSSLNVEHHYSAVIPDYDSIKDVSLDVMTQSASFSKGDYQQYVNEGLGPGDTDSLYSNGAYGQTCLAACEFEEAPATVDSITD